MIMIKIFFQRGSSYGENRFAIQPVEKDNYSQSGAQLFKKVALHSSRPHGRTI